MFKRTIGFVAVAGVVLALGVSANAATITDAGSHLDIGEYIRTTTVAKPLDPDGDNVFGTDGWIFFGVQEDETDMSYKYNQQPNTRESTPSYLTIGTSLSTVQAPTNSTIIDSPDLTPGPDVENDRSGVGMKYGFKSEVDLVTLTIGSGFPAAGVRVGIFTDNIGNKGDADDITYYKMRQTVGGSSSVQVATAFDKDNGNDFYFVDITGAAETDEFVISALSPDTYGPYIGGVTLDTIPEPATLALLGLGGLGLLLRRRR